VPNDFQRNRHFTLGEGGLVKTIVRRGERDNTDN
jgi:hypothetical protein